MPTSAESRLSPGTIAALGCGGLMGVWLLICLAVVVVLSTSKRRTDAPPSSPKVLTDAQALTEILAAGPAVRAEEERRVAENTIRLGQQIRLGNLEIKPIKVQLRKVTIKSFSNKSAAVGPYLVLTYSVKNVSEGQVFKPQGGVRGKDNFGNSLEDPTGTSLIEESEEHKELRPGQTATVIACVEPKIETASDFTLILHTRVDNTDGEHGFGHYENWGCKFNAKEIEIVK